MLHTTAFLLLWSFSSGGVSSERQRAEKLLAEAGVRGGLLVHLYCGGGALTAALGQGEGYVVHGLDTRPEVVRKARLHVFSEGRYGPVSIDLFNGRSLPYADAIVNLLIAESLGKVSLKEVMRVLVPGGVALIGEKKYTKPYPADIDQWTHYLHEANNNAVSHDRRVEQPRHVRWRAGPKRTRHHDALASISAITSSGGRLFYILDEGPTSLVHRPHRWRLIARDAFNGVLLWKRDIPTWVTHLYYFRSGPLHLPRRLVSVGDEVYVTLGLEAPVTKLDAATGRTLRVFEGSEGTEEIACHKGRILVVRGKPSFFNKWAPRVFGYWQLSVKEKPQWRKSIAAYDAASGRLLWERHGEELAYLAALSLCASGENVFYLTGEKLVCVRLEDGAERWEAPFRSEGLFLGNYAPTVVAYRDVVLCLSWNALRAFSQEDGHLLWERKGALGFASPGDLFCIGDCAWVIPITAAVWRGSKRDASGRIRTGIPIPRETFLGGGGREIWALDIHTGEVKRSLPKTLLPGGHHHRCYRNKATERFLLCGRRGCELLDLKDQAHTNNWWLRGICQYGILPANGLLYVPPDPCQCFNLIKVNWFLALSGRSSCEERSTGAVPALLPGPAYGKISAPQERSAPQGRKEPKGAIWAAPVRSLKGDWPTYRGDNTRSCSTLDSVPAELTIVWRVGLGGVLTAPVKAGNRIFVARRPANTLLCLEAATGKVLWRFTAGGPIDSPPTVQGNFCVFGCGDGWVYCLRASDGELVWRFRAAPRDRRIVVENRLQSVWPVHGSLLVEAGTVYGACGLSTYLDGGICLFALDLATGKQLHRAVLASQPSRPGERRGQEPRGLSDILTSDGERLSMRHLQFDHALRCFQTARLRTLIATTGLLEDCFFHRQNWALGWPGKIRCSQFALPTQRQRHRVPLGKLIVFDRDWAYAVMTPYTYLKRTPSMWPPGHEGHFHQKFSRYKEEHFPIGVLVYAQKNERGATAHLWEKQLALQVRAMVLAPRRLFLAGWLDAVAIRERTGEPKNPAVPDPRPSKLYVLRTEDGSLVRSCDLPSEPVFDGMIAGGGRLYLSLRGGTLLCMGGRRK